jgi:hypothetical protein
MGEGCVPDPPTEKRLTGIACLLVSNLTLTASKFLVLEIGTRLPKALLDSEQIAGVPMGPGSRHAVRVADRPIIGTSSSRSAECRLADLESKVDRILHASEKDGHDHTERPRSASPNQTPIEQRH